MFEYHLEPFKKLIAAGVSQMMPYYGMPVGTEFEEVGFNFNKVILTDILREQLGFDGIICTDWGIVSRQFWGVEDLTEEQRMVKSIDAGVDQFGGETEPDRLVGLVRAGHVTEARLDQSVRRLLREKFRLGLFDNPFVDVDAAEALVGSPEARRQGVEAQAHAQTLLKNDDGAARLPLGTGHSRSTPRASTPRSCAGGPPSWPAPRRPTSPSCARSPRGRTAATRASWRTSSTPARWTSTPTSSPTSAPSPRPCPPSSTSTSTGRRSSPRSSTTSPR